MALATAAVQSSSDLAPCSVMSKSRAAKSGALMRAMIAA